MSKLNLYIFDEIFESLVDDQTINSLSSDGKVAVRIVDKKIQIQDCKDLMQDDEPKIICINPDFVDWKLRSEDYSQISNLKQIISTSDNMSWLDKTHADNSGVEYVALKNLHSEYDAVAQYAFTIMAMLARRVPQLMRNGFPINFSHDYLKYQGKDLRGCTVGIVGLGNIGNAIAELCNNFGMTVNYWSRTKKDDRGYKYKELDELLKTSDIIFPTLEPNNETKVILSNEKLLQLKSEAIVVCVVGGLLDAGLLVDRVDRNELFGVGFGSDSKAHNKVKSNVWAEPDYAWATKRNMDESYAQVVSNIKEVIVNLV